MIALTGDEGVKVWDVETGNTIETLDLPQTYETGTDSSATFDSGGQYLAVSYGEYLGQSPYGIILWDATTWEQLRDMPGHEDVILALAFSPDGQLLGTGSRDGTAMLWDVEKGWPILTIDHGAHVESVAFSPDGNTWATGTSNSAIVWDIETGQAPCQFMNRTGSIVALAYAADGRTLISASADHTVKLWPLSLVE